MTRTSVRKKPGNSPRIAAREVRRPFARLEVDERRAQLVAAGLALFAMHAYDEVSLEDIARGSGISKGLLYHYFPTKRDFYVAALREAARDLLGRAIVADTSVSPEVRVRAGLDRYLDFVAERAPAYTALMRGGIGSDRAVALVLDETRGAFLHAILAGLHVAVAPPAMRIALRGWIGFVESASLDWVEKRDLDRDALRELLVGQLERALAG